MTDVVVYVLIAGILACILAMFVVAARANGPNLKNLPELDAAPLLDKKEAGLAADLEGIAAKLQLKVMTKLPLSVLVQARDQKIRALWQQALTVEYVDFVLADAKTRKPVLAILPSGEGRGEQRNPVVTRALEGAAIPFVSVGNYNIAGLEKAVRERIGDAGGNRRVERPSPPPLESAPLQDGAAEPKTADMEAG